MDLRPLWPEEKKKEKKMDLAADRSLPYGYVVDIMARMRDGGVEQLGILTEMPSLEEE